MFFLWFLAGLLLGNLIGIITMALMFAARSSDDAAKHHSR